MLNKENMLKWADALESGNYKQCKATLHNEEGFCCIGVAHDLLVGPVTTNLSDEYEAVRHKCGYDTKQETTFYRMNDTQHKSFKEIAAYIREMVNEA